MYPNQCCKSQNFGTGTSFPKIRHRHRLLKNSAPAPAPGFQKFGTGTSIGTAGAALVSSFYRICRFSKYLSQLHFYFHIQLRNWPLVCSFFHLSTIEVVKFAPFVYGRSEWAGEIDGIYK